MRKSSSGFTIVELLIVIVVIAILATISIVVYTGIRTRAQASAIISDLKNTEKAFSSYKETSGSSGWWNDASPDLTGTDNPTIESLITALPALREYLHTAPTTDGLGTSSSWRYDNDEDVHTDCVVDTRGVNFRISNATNTNLMQTIDTLMDDGDLSCGRVRTSGTQFLYTIDNND